MPALRTRNSACVEVRQDPRSAVELRNAGTRRAKKCGTRAANVGLRSCNRFGDEADGVAGVNAEIGYQDSCKTSGAPCAFARLWL